MPARDKTVEEIGAAKVACEALSEELDAARAALTEAERATSESTVPVLLEEADQVATYLVAARWEVWRLEAQLNGLATLWVPTRQNQGAPRPVRLTRKLLDALSPQEPQYPPSMPPEIKQSAAWRPFHTALLTDSDARWEEEAT